MFFLKQCTIWTLFTNSTKNHIVKNNQILFNFRRHFLCQNQYCRVRYVPFENLVLLNSKSFKKSTTSQFQHPQKISSSALKTLAKQNKNDTLPNKNWRLIPELMRTRFMIIIYIYNALSITSCEVNWNFVINYTWRDERLSLMKLMPLGR